MKICNFASFAAKPEWILKPKDITSVSNSTVTLPCIAFGIPGIRYTWYRNGKLIVPKNRLEFSLGNLTIKDLRPHDNGIYQCFVDNKHGQLYADIKLTVSGNNIYIISSMNQRIHQRSVI